MNVLIVDVGCVSFITFSLPLSVVSLDHVLLFYSPSRTENTFLLLEFFFNFIFPFPFFLFVVSQAHLETIRKNIRDFKEAKKVDKVIVLWTANTERFADIVPGINDTADNLLAAIKASHEEISPSTVYAVACILEGTSFINGSPQNT